MCLDHREGAMHQREDRFDLPDRQASVISTLLMRSTRLVRPGWCVVAVGSNPRLKDSIRRMKSFSFRNVQWRLNGAKLDKSWKLCWKKRKKEMPQSTQKPARYLWLQNAPISFWTAIFWWGRKWFFKYECLRLCPNLLLPGWQFPPSNIQFPLVSPPIVSILFVCQSQVCPEFHEARLHFQDPITPDHTGLSQLCRHVLYFLLISTLIRCAANGMMESQQKNDDRQPGEHRWGDGCGDQGVKPGWTQPLLKMEKKGKPTVKIFLLLPMSLLVSSLHEECHQSIEIKHKYNPAISDGDLNCDLGLSCIWVSKRDFRLYLCFGTPKKTLYFLFWCCAIKETLKCSKWLLFLFLPW